MTRTWRKRIRISSAVEQSSLYINGASSFPIITRSKHCPITDSAAFESE